MLHFLKLFMLLVIMSLSLSQSLGQTLSGVVVEKGKQETIPVTHVINKRTYKGTLTDDYGAFKIQLQWGDTIVFSNIAYKYLYFVYNDSSTALENVLIELEEQNYLLHEVSIFSYKLTSNEDKPIVLSEPRIPSSHELDDGTIQSAAFYNPAEYLYNLFGSKPKQLRMLAQLQADEYYRQKLEESNNRKNVVYLTGLSQEELEAFMFYCKFAPVRMQTMNDYEFLQSVIRCYQSYVKERELEDFLEQFD